VEHRGARPGRGVRPGPPGVHGGGVGLAANWEGPICRTCYDRAVHTHGPCPTCTTERLLPGRRSDGQPICRDCAGITRSFICAGCGTEAALLGRRRCERCTLTDKLTTLLDDGTGRIRRELQPLHAGLSAVDSAQMENLLSWVAQPKINTLLTGLARGTIVISHEALAREPNPRTTNSLRELLMHHGVLHVMDKQLMLFQRWLTASSGSTTSITAASSTATQPGTNCDDTEQHQRRVRSHPHRPTSPGRASTGPSTS